MLGNESLTRQPVRKYNPGTFQSDRDVIDQFVVRKDLLNTVLEVLRGNIGSASCQHVMIIAPRGQGKSMLLACVAAKLRDNDDLSTSLLPVRFMEESLEISNIADFWLETLFYLAREIAAEEPDFSQELQRIHADLVDRWSERAIAEHARSAVVSAVDRLGKKLVLMVENWQDLSGDVDDDFGGKFRQILQSEPQIMLIATATSHFEGLGDVTQPFFEVFRTVYLKPLETAECRRLWQMVSGDKENMREIRPLEILTGGSPRLLVIVAGFAQHLSLRQLLEELVTLVDEHTEYFRGYLYALPKSERRIFAALIDLWRPSSTGEIAARARTEIRTASVMLGRLIKRGAVKVEGRGRKRWYSAVERLHSIFYHLRRERGEAEIVRNLLRFMVAFYKGSELVYMLNEIKKDEEGQEKWLDIIQEVIAEAGDPDRWQGHDEWQEIERAYEEKRYAEVIERIDEMLPFLNAHPDQVSEPLAFVYITRAFAYDALRDDGFQTIKAYDEVLELEGLAPPPDSNFMQWAVITALCHKGMTQNRMGCASAALQTCEALEARLETSRMDEAKVHFEWYAINVRTTALLLQEDRQAAMEVFHSAYARCDVENEMALGGMVDLILNSIVAGASEHHLVDILMNDEKRRAVMMPFVLALCRRLGTDAKRDPIELQEIVADVCKRIDSAIEEHRLSVTSLDAIPSFE